MWLQWWCGEQTSKRKNFSLRQNNHCPVAGEVLITLYAENQDTFKTQAQSRLHETGPAG
jgi:hypothetical protein